MLSRLFTGHPASLGETYAQHARKAARFGAELILAGGACMTHAVIPGLFARTASATVAKLHAQMVRRGASEQRGMLPDRCWAYDI